MNQPLSTILRPTNLDEVVGQEHLIGKDAKLRKLIESDILTSILLFGPPGTGKTTLSEVIANTTKSKFVRLNATQAGVKEIRKWGETAIEAKIILFVDEVHRLNKNQQDILLPYIENGNIIFIGATTENAFFAVNSALLSRCQMVCELEPLKPIHLAQVLKRGLEYYKKNGQNVTIEPPAARHLLAMANGDARKTLAILEVAVAVASSNQEAKLTLDLIKSVSPSKHMVFGDQAHFDNASAFQGSIQASDPNAAIYWLAKWLESGEDPRYIARRLLVSSSEDCAANPEVAIVAHNAYLAAHEIGRPECDIILAHATIMAATAPRNKSAACAIWEAIKDVREGITKEIPKSMRDSHYPGSKILGHGTYHDGSNPTEYVGIDKKYYHPEKWNDQK